MVAYFQVYWTNPTPSRCPLVARCPPGTDDESRKCKRARESQDRDSEVDLSTFSIRMLILVLAFEHRSCKSLIKQKTICLFLDINELFKRDEFPVSTKFKIIGKEWLDKTLE